jgi:hypothetical protein
MSRDAPLAAKYRNTVSFPCWLACIIAVYPYPSRSLMFTFSSTSSLRVSVKSPAAAAAPRAINFISEARIRMRTRPRDRVDGARSLGPLPQVRLVALGGWRPEVSACVGGGG